MQGKIETCYCGLHEVFDFDDRSGHVKVTVYKDATVVNAETGGYVANHSDDCDPLTDAQWQKLKEVAEKPCEVQN